MMWPSRERCDGEKMMSWKDVASTYLLYVGSCLRSLINKLISIRAGLHYVNDQYTIGGLLTPPEFPEESKRVLGAP
jgi:hypothetical protein